MTGEPGWDQLPAFLFPARHEAGVDGFVRPCSFLSRAGRKTPKQGLLADGRKVSGMICCHGMAALVLFGLLARNVIGS
jgi:hypothetical protein